MGILRDVSRFVQIFLLLGLVAVAIGYGQGADPDWLAVGVLVLGVLAVIFVAFRFSEDFEREG